MTPVHDACRPLVEVRDLTVAFVSREATARAVNGVTFELMPGEVLCVIGESGSGKSVTMRALMRLLPPGKARIGGHMRVGEHDILSLGPRALRDLRGGTVSMIFQEPMTALDPVYTIGDQIAETVMRHEGGSRKTARARALELLQPRPGAVARAAARRLSARAVGRAAPACDDRRRHLVPAEPAARRRTDDGARRHRADPGAGAAARAAARARHGDDLRHPRPRRRRPDRRQGGGDVCRAHRRVRQGGRRADASAPPLHARHAGLDRAWSGARSRHRGDSRWAAGSAPADRRLCTSRPAASRRRTHAAASCRCPSRSAAATPPPACLPRRRKAPTPWRSPNDPVFP